MVSGFDIWGHDAGLRRHWKYRFLASGYDVMITIVPTTIVLFYLGVSDVQFYGIYSSFVFYMASAITESMMGASPGKVIFGLKVHAINESHFVFKVFLRNINRLFWFALPPLDLALGMAIRGDPRQRMLDRVAGTKVVHVDEKERHEQLLEALATEQQTAEVDAEDQSEKTTEDTDKNSAGEDLSDNEGPASEDRCRECGGKLILLADDKLQCEDCGLIQ
jgi:uncharacterized RDD family membrane protein YckC